MKKLFIILSIIFLSSPVFGGYKTDTIITSGNVGIGTSLANGRLDVRGDETRIWTGAGNNSQALGSGELYVEGDLEVDGTVYADVVAGSSAWGSISGTLSAQTDLQSALDAKQDDLTFTAADFNLTGVTVSLDYTNVQAASGSLKGFLTSADWTTFNSKQAGPLTGDVTTSGAVATLDTSFKGWTDGGTNIFNTTLTDNVGVGTNQPTGRLDVRGDEARIWTGVGSNAQALGSGELYVEGDLEVDGTLYGDAGGLTNIPSGASGWTDGGTNVYATTTTDNVGIGTTQPVGKLNVVGGNARIGSGGTNTNATSAGEIYVEGDLEVDGTIYGDITSINLVIDGGGVALTTGVKLDVVVPFSCTILQVTTLADVSGSVVLDLWRDQYSAYPPTIADTITASAKPTLSSAIKAQDSTLTGWTTAITAGDTLRVNVDSATTVTRVTLNLKVRK